jgi:ribosome-associated protein
MGKINFRNAAKKAAELIKDKRGKDVLLLDVRGISDFVDYLVIASGTSEPHNRTLIQELEDKLGITAYKKELTAGATWAVIDYGGLMVHIFHENTRSFYGLEKLWNAAKIIKTEKRKFEKKKAEKKTTEKKKTNKRKSKE